MLYFVFCHAKKELFLHNCKLFSQKLTFEAAKSANNLSYHCWTDSGKVRVTHRFYEVLTGQKKRCSHC